MTNDSPDWVRIVEIAVNVDNEPVIIDETTGAPAGAVDRYTGTDTSYQEVAKWTVPASKIGRLHEVALKSTNYAKTVWKLTIGSVTFMEDVTLGGALTLPFSDVSLAAAVAVTISAKSSDGTSITVDGAITGKVIG